MSPGGREPEKVSDLYRQLHRKGQVEQEAFAEGLLAEPGRLGQSFAVEAREFEGFDPRQPFYPAGTRKPLPRHPEEVGSTNDFVSFLWQPPRWEVSGHGELDFHYVDREIVTSRTTKGTTAASFSLDLLLVNADDQTPILGELKVRSDQNAFYALVQALVHAARISTPVQLERLERFYADPFKGASPVERVDLYLVLVDHPTKGTRPNLLKQARRLAEAAMTVGGPVAEKVRRIACIETTGEGRPKSFKHHFSFAASQESSVRTGRRSGGRDQGAGVREQ